MPKETDRIIDTKTEYISRNGHVIKKVTTYSIVGNATFRMEDEQNDNPSIDEFKDVVLGKKDENKDGYVKEEKSSTVS